MAVADRRADQARVHRGDGQRSLAYYPELRLFRYFLAVAAELHFGRAARLLSVSEPVLSRQIRDLERQLCTALFERTKRSVRLTEAGEVLKTEAELLVQQADRTVAAVQRVLRGEVGEVGLGFVPSSVNHILPELVVNFRHENPGVHLSLHETSRAAMVEAIQRGELNVGLVHRPVGLPASDGRLLEETLFTEPYAAVLPRGHRLGRRKRLALSELADEDFILMPRPVMGDRADYLYGACRAAGFTPRVVQEASRSATILGLVAGGVGVGLLSHSHRLHSGAGVAFVPIEQFDEAMVMIWDERRASPATLRLIELARQLAARFTRPVKPLRRPLSDP